jgi:hypothetical protein
MSSMKKDNTGYDIKQLFIGMLLAHRFQSNQYRIRTYPVHVPDLIVDFPMVIAKEVFKYTGIEQFCGSMTFLCGSGSGSADPCL